jgi:hypothetical protein
MGIRSRACLELSIPCVLFLCDDKHTCYQPTSCAVRAISWKAALRGAPRYIMCDACPHRCIFLITARNSKCHALPFQLHIQNDRAGSNCKRKSWDLLHCVVPRVRAVSELGRGVQLDREQCGHCLDMSRFYMRMR